MISSKRKTLLLSAFVLLFQNPILNCNLIASETLNLENKNEIQKKSWFDEQLMVGLRAYIDISINENSQALQREWLKKAIEDKQDKFHKSIENLKDLILANKAVLCKDGNEKKQYHKNRKSKFLNSIKTFFENNFDSVTNIFSADGQKSKQNKIILSLINGFAVDATLWYCFNEIKGDRFIGDVLGFSEEEALSLCQKNPY